MLLSVRIERSMRCSLALYRVTVLLFLDIRPRDFPPTSTIDIDECRANDCEVPRVKDSEAARPNVATRADANAVVLVPILGVEIKPPVLKRPLDNPRPITTLARIGHPGSTDDIAITIGSRSSLRRDTLWQEL